MGFQERKYPERHHWHGLSQTIESTREDVASIDDEPSSEPDRPVTVRHWQDRCLRSQHPPSHRSQYRASVQDPTGSCAGTKSRVGSTDCGSNQTHGLLHIWAVGGDRSTNGSLTTL